MYTLTRFLATACLMLAGSVMAGHPDPAKPHPHLHDDVVRDGRADIIFQGGSALAYSAIGPAGQVLFGSYAGDGGAGYQVVAVSDFDGDGSADVLWTNGSHLKLWVNNGSGGYTSVSVGNYGGGWSPFAAGDINGDGKSDLFFRGSTHLAFWLMDGPSVISSHYAGDGGAGWRVVAINNFFYKAWGKYGVDVLWTNGSQFKFWVGNVAADSGFTPFETDLGSYGGGWEPFAVGDVDGNGIADILFKGGTHIAYWLLDDDTGLSGAYTAQSRYGGDGGAGFRVVAVSDYDGDRSADLLWSNGSTLKLWRLGKSAGGYKPQIVGDYGNGWQPLGLLIRD